MTDTGAREREDDLVTGVVFSGRPDELDRTTSTSGGDGDPRSSAIQRRARLRLAEVWLPNNHDHEGTLLPTGVAKLTPPCKVG